MTNTFRSIMMFLYIRDLLMESYTYSNNNLVTQTTGLSALSTENDKFSSLSTSALLAKSEVPPSHRRVADNYMIIKKIYGFSAVQSRLTNAEKALLAKYDFNPLEYSTIKQINEELVYLKKWSVSPEPVLREEADELIQIRCKELKYIISSSYANITNEIYNGYMALNRYFEDISKYYQF